MVDNELMGIRRTLPAAANREVTTRAFSMQPFRYLPVSAVR